MSLGSTVFCSTHIYWSSSAAHKRGNNLCNSQQNLIIHDSLLKKWLYFYLWRNILYVVEVILQFVNVFNSNRYISVAPLKGESPWNLMLQLNYKELLWNLRVYMLQWNSYCLKVVAKNEIYCVEWIFQHLKQPSVELCISGISIQEQLVQLEKLLHWGFLLVVFA